MNLKHPCEKCQLSYPEIYMQQLDGWCDGNNEDDDIIVNDNDNSGSHNNNDVDDNDIRLDN